MCDGAQKLEGMALFLQRIIRRAYAQSLHADSLKLERLLHAGSQYQLARGANGAAKRQLDRVGKVLRNAIFQHNLEIFEIGAVV